VLQYLQESGNSLAATAFCSDTGLPAQAPVSIPAGSLRCILDAEADRETAQAKAAEGAIAAGEGDNLMPLPDQDQAATAALGDLVLGLDLPTFHATNGLCARLLGDGRVVSGAVDRKIKVARVLDEHGTPLAADAVEATTLPFVSSGPVLTVDAHPVDPTLLLVGDMAGKSAVINFDSPEPVFAATPHAKYVVKVRWSGCGKFFATASYDKSARICVAQDGALHGGGGIACVYAPVCGGRRRGADCGRT